MTPRLHVIVGGRPPYTIAPGKQKSHVTVRHPSLPDFKPLLFDHAEHPDAPALPADIVKALDRIGQHVRVPGTISREDALTALDAVARWARQDLADTTPPHGLPRPS